VVRNKNSYFSPILVSLEVSCIVLISLAIFPHHYIDNFFQIAKSYDNTTISRESENTTKPMSVRMWVEHDPIIRGENQSYL